MHLLMILEFKVFLQALHLQRNMFEKGFKRTPGGDLNHNVSLKIAKTLDISLSAYSKLS